VNNDRSNVVMLRGEEIELPLADNTAEAAQIYRAANERFREVRWPAPFDKTSHRLVLGDARDLSSIASESVHLVVTSPPYWTLKDYPVSDGQLGAIEDYEAFLADLDKVWQECERVLVPGGRICCVVGDVCVPRRDGGRHYIVPLHADIQVRARRLKLDVLTPIIWHKTANGATEVKGNGAGFYGKPYQPNGIVKNDVEYIFCFCEKAETIDRSSRCKRFCRCSRSMRCRAGGGRYGRIYGGVDEGRTSSAVPAGTGGTADQNVFLCG
jgi:modification methylase